MRIIRGLYKGKKIIAPSNLPVRPTTDYAKESLFNILENNLTLEDLNILDLFSGTGNIAYEFASRGAKFISCVDINYHCFNFIQKTIQTLGISNARVIKQDVFRYLKTTSACYDLIFADPPYALEGINTLPDLVFEKKLLHSNGWLIIEHDENSDFSSHEKFLFSKVYGKVNFSFFQQEE